MVIRNAISIIIMYLKYSVYLKYYYYLFEALLYNIQSLKMPLNQYKKNVE